jgi:hypothetical protein
MMVAGGLAEFPLLRALLAGREDAFLGVWVATAVLVFGYGLRTRLPWAWEGTIDLAGLAALAGVLIPLVLIDGRANRITIAGGVILGGCRFGSA